MHTSKPSSRGIGRSRPGEPAAARVGLWLACSLLLCAWAVPKAAAQALPLEIRQDSIRYNLSSSNGLPLSSVRGTPPGSDGSAPTVAQQQAAGSAPAAPATPSPDDPQEIMIQRPTPPLPPTPPAPPESSDKPTYV